MTLNFNHFDDFVMRVRLRELLHSAIIRRTAYKTNSKIRIRKIALIFFASDFDHAAGFSYDGAGDFTTVMFARCQGNHIEILDRVAVPETGLRGQPGDNDRVIPRDLAVCRSCA